MIYNVFKLIKCKSSTQINWGIDPSRVKCKRINKSEHTFLRSSMYSTCIIPLSYNAFQGHNEKYKIEKMIQNWEMKLNKPKKNCQKIRRKRWKLWKRTDGHIGGVGVAMKKMKQISEETVSRGRNRSSFTQQLH